MTTAMLSRRLLNGRAYLVSPSTGGGSGLPAAGTKIDDFQLKEHSSIPSAGRIRIGLVFAKGKCPAGYVPTISRNGLTVTAQLAEVTPWSDGSWKHGIASLRDTPFAASETRSYDITVAPGSFDASLPTGAQASTALQGYLAGHDIRATFANVQQYDGNLGGWGVNPANAALIAAAQTQRGSGSFVAVAAEHATVATRVEQFAKGDVCPGFKVWGMMKDTAGGTEDTQFKMNWYLYPWLNEDGSVYAIETCPVPANADWWDVPNKFQLNYDAALMDGATTIQSYPGVNHWTHSWWLMGRLAADNNICRGHWVGGAIPTLLYLPNQANWVKSGVFPPANLNRIPSASYRAAIPAYVPGSCQDHRYSLDDFGGYMGRGNVPNTDYYAFLRQTAKDYAIARVNWMVGLHIPLHKRSHALRQRPGDSVSDIANTVMPLIMQPMLAADYDFTADGLPPSRHAYFGSSNSLYNAGYAGRPDGNGGDGGGAIGSLGSLNFARTQGQWFWKYPGSSHGSLFCLFGRLHSGDRYFLDATHGQAMRTVQNFLALEGSNQTGNSFCQLLHNDYVLAPGARTTTYRDLFAPYNIPTRAPPYSAMGGWNMGSNDRSHGYSALQQGASAGLTPPTHGASRFFKALALNNSNYLTDSITNAMAKTPSIYRSGHYVDFGGNYLFTHWVMGMNASNAYFSSSLSELPGFKLFADTELAGLKDRVDNCGPGMLGSYWACATVNGTIPYSETTNPYATGDQYTDGANGFILQSDLQTLNMTFCKWGSAAHVPHAVGDIVQYSPFSIDTGGATPTIAELSPATKYYVVAATVIGTTASGPQTAIKISAAPGGAPITFSSLASGTTISLLGNQLKAFHASPEGGMWFLVPGDNYVQVCRSAFAWDVMLNATPQANYWQKIGDWLGTNQIYSNGSFPQSTAYPGWELAPPA